MPCTVEREVEDLEAVVAAAGAPPFVYGHSSGGALALEAAASGVEMRSLAVYEPPYTGDDHPGAEFGEQLDELVATGRRDQAAERWLATTGTPPEAIESIKSSPGYAHMQALAHTLSHDLRLAGDGRPPVERLRRLAVPVLAMAGGASAPWAAAVAATLADAVPGARECVLEGQHHVPADAVLAASLSGFFR
jgi:pimeloyl-ACP methyl ester carboxylesterase